MPTLIRKAGFEVRIYTLDHPPPHVHVARAGAIVKIDEWGKKRLAYEIKDSFDGVYYILYFTATPKTLDEVTRVLGISDTALRFMPIKHEKPFAFQQQPAAATVGGRKLAIGLGNVRPDLVVVQRHLAAQRKETATGLASRVGEHIIISQQRQAGMQIEPAAGLAGAVLGEGIQAEGDGLRVLHIDRAALDSRVGGKGVAGKRHIISLLKITGISQDYSDPHA